MGLRMHSFLFSLAVVASLASTGLALDQNQLQNDNPVTSAGNISVVAGPDAAASRLASAAILDPENNPALVTFTLDNGSEMPALFHNPTEADWFLQFLAQVDQNYSLTITKTAPSTQGSGHKPANPSSVNYFQAVSEGSIAIQILVKPTNSAAVTSCLGNANNYITGDVIIDGQGNDPGQINMVPQVTVGPANGTLDAFTDLIRGALSGEGYFFGTEGEKDEKKSENCD